MPVQILTLTQFRFCPHSRAIRLLLAELGIDPQLAELCCPPFHRPVKRAGKGDDRAAAMCAVALLAGVEATIGRLGDRPTAIVFFATLALLANAARRMPCGEITIWCARSGPSQYRGTMSLPASFQA